MSAALLTVTLVVAEYDPAIAWFRRALGFTVLEDTDMGGGKRWVRLAPPGGGSALLIARAATSREAAAIGTQAGGRVAFFLQTEDFPATHARMCAEGVEFEGSPRAEPYGMVAVFRDLCGNRWDLIGPASA
ncbi:VOC family protein [Oceanicella sp. SM1341]|uniref:VOC family protein n=1 Tax=Oceanicella sp. SM1341 TaxID=1548889 RepID=UPI000E46E8BE|nr:VOC family protein [Oceanicella sp. SM1341]